ncbi:MAG: flagellar hook-basal body protein [Planctomycetes bacterium]|nr:flagellar hook-basal body protein [Planctomycetota bacterium]
MSEYGLFIAAEGAQLQQRRLEVLTNNLANVETPGFKRQLAVFQARLAEQTQRGLDYPGSQSINDLSGGVIQHSIVTDFSSGPMQSTDIPTDLAIGGDGFFVIEKDGQQLLTRAGNFHLNNENRLVTEQGYNVLDHDFSEVTIDPAAGPQELARLANRVAVVLPEALGDLKSVGENLFRAAGATAPVEAVDRRVLSGFVEKSGVNPTLEMMELIETSRMFEANIRLIQQQDGLIGTLLNRVLRA